MQGKEIIVVDCEIKNTIDKINVKWTDYHLMGVSIAVAYRFKTDEYLTFMDDNLADLCQLLNSADLITGFNIEGFDIPLLRGTPQCQGWLDLNLKVYDILKYSRMACGWKPGGSYNQYPKGLKLDDHLLGTFGNDFMKTNDGAEAPGMWQRRELGKLISYCIADVHREAKLFKHIVEHGYVVTPTHGKREIERPML